MLSFSHKSWSLIFCAVSATTTSTTAVENTLVGPWVRGRLARGTAGTRMTGMGVGQRASTVPLSKSAVKMDWTAVLEMTRGAQETRISFAVLEL